MDDILEKFSILGIEPTFDLNRVKKTYYNKMKIVHPDRGGSEVDCKRIIDAYNIIVNYINNTDKEDLINYFFNKLSFLYDNKQYKEAYKILKDIEQYCYTKLDFVIIASMICYKVKDYDSAVRISKKGLEYFSYNITLYNNLAWFYGVGLKDFNNAFYYVNRGLDIDSYNPILLDTIAYLYFLSDQFEKSLFYAKKALYIKSNLPYSLFILANFYFKYYNNTQLAVSLIKKAIYFENDEEEREIFIDLFEEINLFNNNVFSRDDNIVF